MKRFRAISVPGRANASPLSSFVVRCVTHSPMGGGPPVHLHPTTPSSSSSHIDEDHNNNGFHADNGRLLTHLARREVAEDHDEAASGSWVQRHLLHKTTTTATASGASSSSVEFDRYTMTTDDYEDLGGQRATTTAATTARTSSSSMQLPMSTVNSQQLDQLEQQYRDAFALRKKTLPTLPDDDDEGGQVTKRARTGAPIDTGFDDATLREGEDPERASDEPLLSGAPQQAAVAGWQRREQQRDIRRSVLQQFPRFGYHVFSPSRRGESAVLDRRTVPSSSSSSVATGAGGTGGSSLDYYFDEEEGLIQNPLKKKGVNLVKSVPGAVLPPTEAATTSGKSSSIAENNKRTDDDEDLEASQNPHFPCNDNDDVDKLLSHNNTDDKAFPHTPAAEEQLTQQPKEWALDAYTTRPHDLTPSRNRSLSFWESKAHRDISDERQRYFNDHMAQSLRDEGPMDTASNEFHSNKIRRETLLFLQHFPVNEMVQDAMVQIIRIEPADGQADVVVPPEERVTVPLSEGLAMAKAHQLDLVRIGESTETGGGVVGNCILADSRRLTRETVRFKLAVQGGIQPPRLKECIEVPFRGGTHPFAIRVKAYGIAKHIVRRAPVRVNLTDFGSPREGFPVFQTILDEIKKQCTQLRAFHSCGPVQSNYNEIYCYLHPSTAKAPKSKIQHPSPAELAAAMAERIDQNDREISFDDYYNLKHPKERLAYQMKLENGLAWAEKDEGLSLKRQRDIKLMLGYIPKGNKELYSLRGDVDVRFPFRSSHPTSTEKFSYPPESNLEQADRGAAVLGKRLEMDIATMHDRNETSEHASELERFYYRISGPALQVGEVKESFGFKRNRKRVPGMMPGTLGDASGPQEDALRATK